MRAGLPLPALSGSHQLQNAAGVLMVVELLKNKLPVTQIQLREGLLSASLAGRFQVEQGEHTLIYDVAHNPAAALQLADTLQQYRQQQRVHAVFSVLRDKDLAGIVRPFCTQVTTWYIAPLGVPRAADVELMHSTIANICPNATIKQATSINKALKQAKRDARSGDIILVFGSFYTVAQAHP